ncbi:TPA: hypothetical protein ACRGQ2_005772, partial [Klebsiella pneumoniae]
MIFSKFSIPDSLLSPHFSSLTAFFLKTPLKTRSNIYIQATARNHYISKSLKTTPPGDQKS